jgi:flagellar biosynthesis chaperone FliJ
MSFHFGLQSILKLSQQKRELEKQAVQVARNVQDRAVAHRDGIARLHAQQLDELRNLQNGSLLDIDRILCCQRHAEVLRLSLSNADDGIAEAAATLRDALDRLSIADRAAQSLERLAVRKLGEFQQRQSRFEEQELGSMLAVHRRPSS